MIDILIVGAGPSGLCAAKTFLQYNTHADIVLVDTHATPGGVWSQEQLYPTLKTNNLFSSLDFTDFPMEASRFGVRGPEEHIPGAVMHAYLAAYAEHFSITPRIRFNTHVVEIRRRAGKDGWDVETTSTTTDGQTTVLSCRRLVVATGVLSVPHLPTIQGAEDFDGPIIHSSELGPKADAVFHSPKIKTVAVLGGCKSAYDAVYLAATTGHKVEWIIRKSGRGPTWVFPTHTYLGPFRAWREKLVTRRVISLMSPWVWPDLSGFGWLRGFLHDNRVGRFIKDKFWAAIHADTVRDCQYRTDDRLGVLEPEQSPYWYGTASGVLNYDTAFHALITSNQVRIHRADISHLTPHHIHLTSTPLPIHVDALIASTGYSSKPTITFSPPTLHSALGVPTTALSKPQRNLWATLTTEADAQIAQTHPSLLRGPPAFNPGAPAEIAYTPWRLYRGIAPPGLTAEGDRSLVFIGMFSNIANTLRLEMQCLWALAYFEGTSMPNVERDVSQGRVYAEAALLQRFAQLRAPYGHGRLYPDLVFDQLPYWDGLLADVGVETRRKGAWWRELVEPYGQGDYVGVVAEWIEKAKGQGRV
ncbi:cofactor FMO1 FAD enzyme [Podospora appendiculata]|uniref:Cofactor FMO1 FAD enzyme n=1 Tax=Podospora appendiculata TaxID=314037 RepID=A0AAE0WZ13_9PEZI|nr:cofactor FMO1 FAD enzyme [Podospora appendiculata]